MKTRVWSGVGAVGVILFALGLAWGSLMPGEGSLLGILGGHCEAKCISSSLQRCNGTGCVNVAYCECNSTSYADCVTGNDWCSTAPNCGLPAGRTPCYCKMANACGQWS
jgi:hypothetical protein